MGNRLYLVFAVVGIVLVVAWHVADEAGMPKDVRLYSACVIVGFIAVGTVAQGVRAVARRSPHRTDDTGPNATNSAWPFDSH